MCTLVEYHGALVVVGNYVEKLASRWSKKTDMERRRHHVTLLTAAETRKLSRNSMEIISRGLSDFGGMVALGKGNLEDRCFFVVVEWEEGNEFRESLQLPRKDFHITLEVQGGKDIHESVKDVTCLVADESWTEEDIDELLNRGSRNEPCCSAAIHHAQVLKNQKLKSKGFGARARVKGLRGEFDQALIDAETAVELDNQNPRNFLILGDCLRAMELKSDAKDSYSHGFSLLKGNNTRKKLRDKFLSRLEEAGDLCTSFKFPKTEHCINLGAATTDDIMANTTNDFADALKNGTLIVEEKLDGANLGIFFDSEWNLLLQNRGHFVNKETGAQWPSLELFFNSEVKIRLAKTLRQRFAVFGEWLYAKHSILYTKLPSLFVAFDVFDRAAGKFLSVESRNRILAEAGLEIVPRLSKLPASLGKMAIEPFLGVLRSKFSDELAEGIVLRIDEPSCPGASSFLIRRAKIVRGVFQDCIEEHWTRQEFVKNHLEIPWKEEQSNKYPSTPHLPFSPGVNEDDIVADYGVEQTFANGETRIIITEKLDGGNCCLKNGQVYGRTHSHEATHWSFSQVKQLYNAKMMEKPEFFFEEFEGIELFGENMAAIHSIEYNRLTSPFYLFGARLRNGIWLSWDELDKVSKNLGFPTVPLVFDGILENVHQLRQLMEAESKLCSRASSEILPEGFVVRVASEFKEKVFEQSIHKYVRKDHIQTQSDWKATSMKATIHFAAEFPRRPAISSRKFQIFVDLDGVLADFDGGVMRISKGRTPDEIPVSQMWRWIQSDRDFFGSLDWMPDAEEMWTQQLVAHKPTILSGVPMSSTTWAQKQKRNWCTRKLGPEIPVILCATREKSTYSGPGRVLIDDRPRNGKAWEEKGGTFILHKSPSQTIAELNKLLEIRNGAGEGPSVSTINKKKRKPKFRFILLVGAPGTGKSTFAAALTNEVSYELISQDDLGSRSRCEAELGKLIKKNSVVLDRCNVESEERKRWIQLSMVENRSKIAIVYFPAPDDPQQHRKRVLERKDHPTITTNSDAGAERIINSFLSKLDVPNAQRDGVSRVFTVHHVEDHPQVLKQL